MRNIPNIAKSTILLGIFLFIGSCYHPKTHGTFISESQDAWIDGYAIRINEHKIADKGLVFCRANIKENGSARPKCYKAEFQDKVDE